jgi:hypothetical protein
MTRRYRTGQARKAHLAVSDSPILLSHWSFWKAQWFAEGFAIVVFEVILSWIYIISYKIIQFPRAIISSYIRWMICGMMFGVDSHNLRTINSRFHIDPPAPKAMCLLDIDCCFKRAEIKWQVLVRPPSGKDGHQKSPSPPAHLSFPSPSLPLFKNFGTIFIYQMLWISCLFRPSGSLFSPFSPDLSSAPGCCGNWPRSRRDVLVESPGWIFATVVDTSIHLRRRSGEETRVKRHGDHGKDIQEFIGLV